MFSAGLGLALFILVVTGVVYRLAATRLGALAAQVSLPRGSLERLPLRLGNWYGQESPLDETLVRATDTDDHVSRSYVRVGTPGVVALFIGYGVHLRDLMPHRPDVCYPGAGWAIEDRKDLTVPLSAGGQLPCRLFTFRRGGLDAQRIHVLNYYIVDGEPSADVSSLRAKAWRFETDVAYVAQVQVSCTSRASGEDCERLVLAFLDPAAPAIQQSLEAAVAEVLATTSTSDRTEPSP